MHLRNALISQDIKRCRNGNIFATVSAEVIGMNASLNVRNTHFHIQWSSGRLDWQRFDNLVEADESAKRLVRSNENYTIEEFSEICPRCGVIDRNRGFRKTEKSEHNTEA